MPKYVCIVAHISIDELENRYRKATSPVERSHFQIIWLLARGKRVREVAENTGYCANWIRFLARRSNQDGPQVLTDQRKQNTGAPALLSSGQKNQLRQLLEQIPPDGGLWTGPKVAHWMSEQTGRKIHAQRGWDYLKHLGFSLHIPRPRHHKADTERQEAFKRALPEQVKHIQQAHPQAEVELWCMDEHRIGLKPVLRRVWARKGQRPIVRVQHRYQWLYVYSFVCPELGVTHWLLLPTVSIEVFAIALVHFARSVGAGPDRRIILVLDCAGWHNSQTLVIPDGIHLVFLPPYSPELQPCERLWPLSGAGYRQSPRASTLDELQEVQAQRCVTQKPDPIGIRHIARFHWWPASSS